MSQNLTRVVRFSPPASSKLVVSSVTQGFSFVKE